MKLLANHISDSLDDTVYLIIKRLSGQIWSHYNMGMSGPCFQSSLI